MILSDDLPEAYLRFLYGSRIDQRTLIHSRPDAVREARSLSGSFRGRSRRMHERAILDQRQRNEAGVWETPASFTTRSRTAASPRRALGG